MQTSDQISRRKNKVSTGPGLIISLFITTRALAVGRSAGKSKEGK